MTPILEASDLTAGYGKMAVVRDLDLEVNAGEIVALVGANGAGKTTTILTLAGELPPLGGDVRWLGDATAVPLYRRAREGLSLVTAEQGVFASLTVRENLRVCRCDAAEAIEHFPELEDHLDRQVALLSGGQRRMLSLARAVAGSTKVVLADELSMGLAPLVVDRLLRELRAAADRGVAVLLVEQHVDKALAVADRAYIMARGRISLHAGAATLRDDPAQVEAAYFAT
jgi:ABC-type branched-subunit amino acid transport system ATPase component